MSNYRDFRPQPNSFRLQRNPGGIGLSKEVRREFEQKFPNHVLYSTKGANLAIIGRKETESVFEQSGILSHRTLGSILVATLAEGPQTAKGPLTLPIQKVDYYVSDNYNIPPKINLFLEDKNGIIQEERARYLRALGRLTGITINPDFTPDLTLGVTTRETMESEALTFLGQQLPDEVRLRKVVPVTYPIS
jgi:hypothetical protein